MSRTLEPSPTAGEPPSDAAEIDVRELIADFSVEEHCRRAEAYFARHPCLEELLGKPLAKLGDAPDLLFSFVTLVRGLELFPGATVVDFGAGTCWASHFLSQLGCRAVAVDPSATALGLGEELYRRRPPFGDPPAPAFLVFDGHRIELEDGSVDRVLCLDALHHVPNPDEVIAELGRVLVDGGIAGFAEPGPDHSRTPHSQAEMRRYRVIENDLDLGSIWTAAERHGFADLRAAVFHRPLYLLGLEPFEAFLSGAGGVREFADRTREVLANERVFFLYKRGERARDSRQAAGLHARIAVEPRRTRLAEGEPFEARVSATNDGSATWLPTPAGIGGVSLGCNLLDAGGELQTADYLWFRQPVSAEPVRPGESVSFDVSLPLPGCGRHVLELDLVSEGVSWFAVYGTPTVRISIEVV